VNEGAPPVNVAALPLSGSIGFRRRSRARFGEFRRVAHQSQERGELRALDRIEAGQQPVFGGRGGPLDGREPSAPGTGDRHDVPPAVDAVAPAFDQPRGFEVVEDPDELDRIVAGGLAERLLTDGFVAQREERRDVRRLEADFDEGIGVQLHRAMTESRQE